MLASCPFAGFARLIARTVSHFSGVEERVLDYELLGDAVGLLQVDVVVLPGSGAPAAGVEQRQGKPAIAGDFGGLGAALTTLQTGAVAHVGDGAVVGLLLAVALMVAVVAAILLYCGQVPDDVDGGSDRRSLKLIQSPYPTGGSGRPSLSGSVRDDDAASTSVGPSGTATAVSVSTQPISLAAGSSPGSDGGKGVHDRAPPSYVGPPPLCSHLMLTNDKRKPRFLVSMDQMMKISTGSLHIFGPSGNLLLKADVKKTKEQGRVLSIGPPGGNFSCRFFASPSNDGRVPPMKIFGFGETNSFYGTLETDIADRSKVTLMKNNKAVMLLERGSKEEFRIDASCMQGHTKVKLATAARNMGASSHTSSQSGDWKIEIEPGVDSVLLTGAMLSVTLLQPMGSSMQAQNLGSSAQPGAGRGFAAAAADALAGPARQSTDGRADMGGRLSTGSGVMFVAPAPAMMQAPPGQQPAAVGRLGTDERLSLGGRIAPGQ